MGSRTRGRRPRRALVGLAGHWGAPAVRKSEREAAIEVGRFWREWWRVHGGDAFRPASPEESRRALRRWNRSGRLGRAAASEGRAALSLLVFAVSATVATIVWAIPYALLSIALWPWTVIGLLRRAWRR